MELIKDEDRIIWRSSDAAVSKDMMILNAWNCGRVTTAEATRKLQNRYQEQKITQEKFIKNANWLGYFRSYYE